MLKPDMEFLHAEAGRIFYQGKIYDLQRRAMKWAITRPDAQLLPVDVFVGDSLDDVTKWMQLQLSPNPNPMLD